MATRMPPIYHRTRDSIEARRTNRVRRARGQPLDRKADQLVKRKFARSARR
jgi:hypothetical protein